MLLDHSLLSNELLAVAAWIKGKRMSNAWEINFAALLRTYTSCYSK